MMSKAVLVIDKPKCCLECGILNHEELTCFGHKLHFGELYKIQSWCPLKPLEENYISIDWLKYTIPFQNEEDRYILLSMLEAWRKENENNFRNTKRV